MSTLPIDPNHASNNAPGPLSLQRDDLVDRSHPGVSNPLSDAHLDQLAQFSKRVHPVEKCIGYAGFSGWMTLLTGVISMPFALHNSPMLIFVILIAGIGTRELSLRRSLKMLDMKAPKKLALNQVMLGGLLIGYAVFMLASPVGPGLVEKTMKTMKTDPMLQSAPELSGTFDDLIAFEKIATAMIYVSMILIAFAFQGSTALYYLLKGKKLKKLHKHTPHWVIRVYQTIHV